MLIAEQGEDSENAISTNRESADLANSTDWTEKPVKNLWGDDIFKFSNF